MKDIKLTEVELHILKMIALGYENKEIAKELFMSFHSVKAYLALLYKKFKVDNRTHLTYIAFKNNLLPKDLERGSLEKFVSIDKSVF